MKRLLLGISLAALAAVLGGCPIYPSQQEYQVCTSAACYSCPDTSLSGACTPWPCQSDPDCPGGYSCDPATASCVAGSTSGADGGTSTDCSVTGCPTGQVCKLAGGVAQCVSPGSSGGGDASTGTEDGATEASSGTDAASETGGDGSAGNNPEAGAADADASDGSTTVTGPCNSDAACGGHGEKCIDGQCTVQALLCSDGSQCEASGFACVDGVCRPHCSTTNFCPTGMQCDLTRGVCSINPAACTGSGTSTCQGGTTCVEGFCVAPCGTGDAAPVCLAGQVCVNGGCLPDEKATFSCTNDGQSGQLATSCATGEICVHHDCYLACSVDGGSSCSTGAAASNLSCKNVTIETGAYSVCGTSSTLGSDCDASQGKYCSSGKACVDGYCI